ncbi:hypothetical protein GZH49_29015 [Nocardia terpenica]|uniref:hypothetical protein n=1 Tax=Nocardia terpenica TaxID=455432 RepID=UPI002FE0D420
MSIDLTEETITGTESTLLGLFFIRGDDSHLTTDPVQTVDRTFTLVPRADSRNG